MNRLTRIILIIVAVSVPLSASYTYNPLPYFSDENEQYNTVTQSYVTPHLKWAKPYLGGRARVLIIAPRWSMRETVELMQRMDLDATVFAVASDKAIGYYYQEGREVWEGFNHRSRMNKLESLVEEDWDAVIYAGFSPRPCLGRVLERVKEEGMGLLVMPEAGSGSIGTILTHHDTAARDRIIRPVPVEDITVMKEVGRENILLVAEYGRGRIAHIKIGGGYRGCFTSDVSDPVDFEYCLALVIRTIMWATGMEQLVEIESAEWPKSFDASTPGSIRIAVDRMKLQGMTPRIDIIRKGESNLPEALVDEDIAVSETGAGYRFTLPILPEGQYFYNIHLCSEAAQATWYSGAFSVTSDVGIDSVTTERECFKRGEIVQGQVILRGKPATGSKVSLSLIDGFGRVMVRKNLVGASTQKILKFSLPLEDVLHNAMTIQAELTVDGKIISVKKCEIFAPARGQNDFKFVMWSYDAGRTDRVTQLLANR